MTQWSRVEGMRLALVVLFCAIAISGCNKETTSIKTLLDDPSQFDDKTVRIAGEVQDAAGVFGMGTYSINDGTGTIRVVTKSGGTPRGGAKVGVEGEFQSAYTFGDDSGAVIIESKRYTP